MLRDTVPSTNRIKQNANGIFLFYDTSRNKWLSTSRDSVSFGINNRSISIDRWMSVTSGLYSNNSGYRIPRDCTITALTVQTKNSSNCTFKIKVSGNILDVIDIVLNNEIGKTLDNIDENVNKDDWLQSQLVVNSGSVDYPVLLLEFAWR